MKVNHSGWNETQGFYNYDIDFDETRCDYEIHYKNGGISKQNGPFENHTADWNNDGDVYTQFCAFFDYYDADGSRNGGDAWTPVDLVTAALDAQDLTANRGGYSVIKVVGVDIPPVHKRESLDERIIQSEKRAFHQEIELNQKMNALGIRPPGEPWAR